MALEDLFTAMNMFKEGAQQLQLSRAIGAANDQVQQIRASEASEQEKRTQLQQLSNGLVAHMAQIGTPATTMQAVAGAIGPKQYANSNQMNADAVLTGNKQLGEMAQQQQEFENDPKYELARLKAQQKLFNQSPLGAEKLKEQMYEFDSRQVKDFASKLDASAASSRSAFGQWASVDQNGQRLMSVLGDRNSWNNLTPQQLELLKEGIVKMSKGGAATESEMKALSSASLALSAAEKASYVSGKPPKVDLSPYAGLFSDIIHREGQAAKKGILNAVLTRANQGSKLLQSSRTADETKIALANSLKQAGLHVNPETITWDKKQGLVIPEIQPVLSSVQAAPAAVREMMVKAKAGDAKAVEDLKAWGLTTSTPMSEAIEHVQSHIQNKLWE